MDTNGMTEDRGTLRGRVQSGASWFYWIAALSVINSIIAATGSTWGFMAGLGVTQLIDGLGMAIGAEAKAFTLALDVAVAAMFAGLGVWAGRNAWAYLGGMILYALDGSIFVFAGDWVGLAFHGLVLWFLWGGWMAQRALARMPATTTSPEAQLDRAA